MTNSLTITMSLAKSNVSYKFLYFSETFQILDLLSAARRVCSKILPSIAQNLPSPLKIRRPNENDENTSEPLLRDQQQTQKHDVEKVMTDSKRLQGKNLMPFLLVFKTPQKASSYLLTKLFSPFPSGGPHNNHTSNASCNTNQSGRTRSHNTNS